MPETLETPTTTGYRARVLPTDEWRRRQGELSYPPGTLEPNDLLTLVVVEDAAGAIVGSWCIMPVLMLEGAYVEPGYRKGPAIKALLTGMLQTLQDIGAPTALTYVTDSAVERLARHLGFQEIPGTLYQIALPTLPTGAR